MYCYTSKLHQHAPDAGGNISLQQLCFPFSCLLISTLAQTLALLHMSKAFLHFQRFSTHRDSQDQNLFCATEEDALAHKKSLLARCGRSKRTFTAPAKTRAQRVVRAVQKKLALGEEQDSSRSLVGQSLFLLATRELCCFLCVPAWGRAVFTLSWLPLLLRIKKNSPVFNFARRSLLSCYCLQTRKGSGRLSLAVQLADGIKVHPVEDENRMHAVRNGVGPWSPPKQKRSISSTRNLPT